MIKSTKELAKELYSKGYSTQKIAEILDKNPRTIKNYKNKEWEMERANFYNSLKGNRKEIYSSFVEEMHLAIKEIRESDIKAEKKAEALSRLGDSFAKMKNVATYEDPRNYALSIVKKTITALIEELKKDEDAEILLNKIVDLLENPSFIEKISKVEL